MCVCLPQVGADWSVRIYVEVVMHDLFPGGGAGGTPGGMSMSQYCLTLVIEPPVQVCGSVCVCLCVCDAGGTII